MCDGKLTTDGNGAHRKFEIRRFWKDDPFWKAKIKKPSCTTKIYMADT